MTRDIPELTPLEQERFWAKIVVADLNECWLWTASVDSAGYGRFSVSKVIRGAHRIALILETGPPPNSEVFAIHSCDNKRCVNPLHLRWGTHLENVEEAVLRSRFRRGEAHHRSKLTADDVRYIRASTERLANLSIRFGVEPSGLCLIKQRKAWKHVTDA